MSVSDDVALTSATLVSKIDAGDPLYLHPSDASNLTVVSVKLKGTDNYSVWSNAMMLALQVKNKLGFIDGTYVKPVDNVVLAMQWDRCNYVVLTWILNSISDELYLGQVYSKLAKDVWCELKETYDKIDGSVIFNLYQKINGLTQSGMSVSEYYHKLNTMWKQLDQMLQLPACVCNASKGFNDFNHLVKLMQFLMGLDSIYQPVRTNLLLRDPLPTIKDAYSVVSREESHRGSNGLGKGVSQSSSFVSKSYQTNDNKKKFVKGPNPNLKCTHCGKLGHLVDRCYEIVGYPSCPNKKPYTSNKAGWSNNVVSDNVSEKPVSNVTNNLTSEQFAKLLSLLGESESQKACHSNNEGLNNKEKLGDW